MKKKYISPAQQVVRLETAPLLLSVSETETSTQLAREFDNFDDE